MFSNRPYSRYPPSLPAHKDLWVKSNVTWFLRGQTSDKICQYKKSRLCLVILDNWKLRTFYLKDNKIKLRLEVIVVMFFNAVATVDVLTASNNDVRTCRNLNRTFCKFKIALSFWGEKKNSTAITRISKFYHLFAPWDTTWHCFYPSNPKARAKMAGIVNKVY